MILLCLVAEPSIPNAFSGYRCAPSAAELQVSGPILT
jgi:hypothetical protein